MPRALILLATHNGETYINELIASIRCQTEHDWQLVVSDDHSTDATREVIAKWEAEDPRIARLAGTQTRLGAKDNFNLLLESAADCGAELVFLCDQDDVWREDKLARTLAACGHHDSDEPLLMVSRCKLIGPEGHDCSGGGALNSAIKDAPEASVADVCSRNLVPGCLMAFTPPLISLACPILNSAIMHDWWLLLLAKGAGLRVVLIDEPLVAYRQHKGNVVGAPTRRQSAATVLKRGPLQREDFLATFDQAQAAQARLQQEVRLSPPLRQLGEYSTLLQVARPWRIISAINLGIRKSRPLLLAVFIFRLLLVHKAHESQR